jgi:methionyl-tRNA formyltransferase
VPHTALRIIFAGTPEFAASHLRGLLRSRHNVIAVYTQPDRPAGRGKKLQSSAVKQIAVGAGVPVFQPASLRDEQAQQELANLGADLMIVVAYGLILPQAVLEAPKQGCLNVHASLLPRWRGAAPIQRAIEAGDMQSGITIMEMDAGLDTGNMLAIARCPITDDTTAASLHDELATLGMPLLLDVLDSLPEHLANGAQQDDDIATYASKILKPEAEIDWREDAEEISRKVRAFNPFPICFTLLGDERLKVHSAAAIHDADVTGRPGSIFQSTAMGIIVACGSGQLSISKLQLPGGKALSAEQMLNAKSALFSPGVMLGSAQISAESS